MDEALKFAKQSLELAPGVGGYYDTLAHVYAYGKKDYENAVKTQSKAAELEPRSRIIQEKLELFRKAGRGEEKGEMSEPLQTGGRHAYLVPLSLWERAGVRGSRKNAQSRNRRLTRVPLTPTLSQRERGTLSRQSKKFQS